MALFADLPSAVPDRPRFLSGFQHVQQAGGQVVPLFDDGPPGGPDGGMLANGQGVAESLQILGVEGRVVGLFHVVRVRGPLGVDIEHEEAVKAVAQSDALHGL